MVERELWKKAKRRLGWKYGRFLGDYVLCYYAPRLTNKSYIRLIDPKFMVWYEEMEDRYGSFKHPRSR